MARSLSVDLRRRVVGAIEGGSSCRAAAQRFGVSASSAIRWRAQERREGDIRAFCIWLYPYPAFLRYAAHSAGGYWARILPLASEIAS